MALARLYRIFGWAGMIAGLFAFLTIGGTAQACAPGAEHAAAAAAIVTVPVATGHSHVHAHGHAVVHDHAAMREPVPTKGAVHNHEAPGGHDHCDCCKDGVCGLCCHALAGPAGIAFAIGFEPLAQLSPVPDRLTDGRFDKPGEEPPRA